MSDRWVFRDPTTDDGCVLKDPESVRVIVLDWFRVVASFWRPGHQYSSGDVIRPLTETGFAYQAGAGGQTGPDEPKWPKTLGGTVADGSITWTAIAAGGNGVSALTSPAVAVTPSGELVIGTPEVVNGKGTDSAIRLELSDGEVGKVYRVELEVTAGSQTLVGSMRVKVLDR